MAQTKRKRSTKHRGNAAGVVETRGRTGRKLTEAERKAGQKPSSGGRRQDRFDRPPTWRSAANRSLVAVVIFVAVLVLLLKQNLAAAFSLGAVMLLFYIPLSYYTDLALHRRRQRQREQPKPARKDEE